METLERFHQVQNAWRCLSDSTRRLLYDLRTHGSSSMKLSRELGGDSVDGCEAQLLELQKQQAKRDVENMEVQFQRVLYREKKTRGVIVRQAIYGDLTLREESFEECITGSRTIESEDLVGPLVEVAAPLQCLVEQHTIVLRGGASASKADLPGFYNPVPLNPEVELSLYMVYEFQGRLHEVFVGDREALSVPMRKHAVPAGKHRRGPFSPSNVGYLRHSRSQGSRRSGSSPIRQAKGEAGKDQHSRSQQPPQSRADKKRARVALARAVRAHRVESLQEPGEDHPSRREFLIVAMLSSLTIGAAFLVSRRLARGE